MSDAQKETLNGGQTATQVQDVNIEENFDYLVDAPLFIKFAEYLGFVSEMVKWCDELCNGNDIPEYKKKFIEIEAKAMFNEMLKVMTRDEIKHYYESFYEVILYEWDDKLQELKQKLLKNKK